MQNEISIIIPVYNGAKFVTKCIESALNQTFQGIEVIIIDDGSTDESFKILQDYERKYPEKIRAFTQDNIGVAKTRNRGIDLVRTKYLTFIDQDDFLDLDFCETLYNVAAKEEIDIVLSGFKRPGADGRIVNKYVQLTTGPYAPYVCTGLWAKLHRTDFVRANDIRVFHTKYGEDIAFVLKEYANTDRIKVVEGYVGYSWTYNTESVSNTSQKKVLAMLPPHLELLGKIKEYDTKHTQEHEYYILQTVVFYLLWTGQLASRQDFMYAYHQVIDWLRANYPHFRKNKYIFFGPKGAPTLNKLSIGGLMLIHRLHMMNVFAWIYCRR